MAGHSALNEKLDFWRRQEKKKEAVERPPEPGATRGPPRDPPA
jgi:hypothetical protein